MDFKSLGFTWNVIADMLLASAQDGRSEEGSYNME